MSQYIVLSSVPVKNSVKFHENFMKLFDTYSRFFTLFAFVLRITQFREQRRYLRANITTLNKHSRCLTIVDRTSLNP